MDLHSVVGVALAALDAAQLSLSVHFTRHTFLCRPGWGEEHLIQIAGIPTTGPAMLCPAGGMLQQSLPLFGTMLKLAVGWCTASRTRLHVGFLGSHLVQQAHPHCRRGRQRRSPAWACTERIVSGEDVPQI